MTLTTLHTYSDLLVDGGRLAAVAWPTADLAGAVAATLRADSERIILAVTGAHGCRVAVGQAPGGLA